MRSPSRRTWSVAGVLGLTAMLLVLPAAATAADFVLTAPNWGNKQDAAVVAAGGTVVWSHSGTGIASVTSDNPDFLAQVHFIPKETDDSVFKTAAEDMMVEWQDPNIGEQAITPGDEPFVLLGISQGGN